MEKPPIHIVRNIYSFLCKEDADPQGAWLARKMRAEKVEKTPSSDEMYQRANEESEPASSFTQTASSKSPDVWISSTNEARGTQPESPSHLSDPGARGTQPESPPHLSDPRAPITQLRPPTDSSGSQGPLSEDNSNKGHPPVQVKVVDRNQNNTPPPESKESPVKAASMASIDKFMEPNMPKNFKTTSVANGHYASIGQYINACFQSGKICDMCFRIGDLIWPVHRVVLASQSNLFRGIFESEDFSTKPWTPKQIALRGVEQETLSAFLQFLYSGDINIQANMIPDLLRLARVFEVEKLKILCHQQIPLMNNEDLLKLLKTMILVKDYELCDIIMRVIAERGFGQIRECDAFYDLDVQTLCMVLSYDGLIVKSEVEVFNAAVAWLHHHNIEERMKSLEIVMDSIRFSLMNPKNLFNCYKKCPSLKENAYCNQLITMANWVQTSISLNEEDPLNIEFPPERNAVSGTNSVHLYMNTHCSSMPDPVDPVEFTISPLPQEIVKDFNDHACLHSSSGTTVPIIQTYSKSKASVVDKKAPYKEAMIWADPHWYIVGGAKLREGRSPIPTNTVLKYSYERKKWLPMTPMNVARMKHSLCVLDGLIYAIGGIGEGNRPLNTVECYNPQYDCWFFVKDLPEPRAGASASAEGGNIYLQGGYRGLRGKGKPCFFYPGEEVCRYNVHTNKWTTGY